MKRKRNAKVAHGDKVDNSTNARIDRELRDPHVTTTFGGRRGRTRGRRRNPAGNPFGQTTEREWRESWKRGANLIVYNHPSIGMHPPEVAATDIILRLPGRGRTIDVYDGKTITPHRRRGVPVARMYFTKRAVHFEVTHLVMQSDGLPSMYVPFVAAGKKRREPHTFQRQVELTGQRDANGQIRWPWQGVELRDGTPWQVPAQEIIDKYDTLIDELIEIAARELPTGAYTVQR